MSNLAPKYGEPAPDAPAVPKARSGRSICTAETGVPPASPPTIQAVEPVTALAACNTGTWIRPAGSSRLVAGLKAQIADTAEPPAPDGPDNLVVPRPRGARRAAGLSPPATNTSPSTVTAAAPASGSGRRPMTAAVCRAGSTVWITFTADPAPGPVMAWPPNT